MELGREDIDQNLLLQFTRMGTTDRADLIEQFKQLIHNKADDSTLTFYLEMNNWNLQGAVWSYFEYDSQQSGYRPSMSLVKAKLLPAFYIPPNSKFSISWTVRNTGADFWQAGTTVQFVSGSYVFDRNVLPLRSVGPGSTTTVMLDLTSPSECGVYQSQWRAVTADGNKFGDALWIMFQVVSKLSSDSSMMVDESSADEASNVLGSLPSTSSDMMDPDPSPDYGPADGGQSM